MLKTEDLVLLSGQYDLEFVKALKCDYKELTSMESISICPNLVLLDLSHNNVLGYTLCILCHF